MNIMLGIIYLCYILVALLLFFEAFMWAFPS